jgi:hypothetical protein
MYNEFLIFADTSYIEVLGQALEYTLEKSLEKNFGKSEMTYFLGLNIVE